MPIGSYAAVPTVASQIFLRRPGRVLDLGMGFGMHGFAVRQWLDLGVRPWHTTVVGVEIWEAYRNPVWDLYDAVYIRTIERHLELDQGCYDLVLLGDVIEHFEMEAGDQVLEQAKRRVAPGGAMLVTTPADAMEQGAAHGNPYECHRSVWPIEQWQDRGFEILLSATDPQPPPAVPSLVARWINHPPAAP